MPLIFVLMLMAAMLRGVGDAMTPLVALAISAAIGLLATPALILGWFGLPRLGIVSAAWGSVVSSVLTLTWLAFHLRRREHVLMLGTALARAMRPDLALLPTLLRLGIPAAIGMVVMSVAELVLLGLVGDCAQPHDRSRRRLGRLSDHVLCHVHSADGLLPAGVAKARSPASDLIDSSEYDDHH
ncbi:hypothetical protein [Bradyrhizobium sp. CB82]|uniref:hypothetical protein n=1 Tax=Bradyrhizobium sp. CB82 TaxID=3039159 RepID=UPI0032C249C4